MKHISNVSTNFVPTINTRFLYKIQRNAFFSNQFSFPSKMSLNLPIRIKTQYFPSNLCQNTITLGIVPKIVRYIFFFPLNKPTLQLDCMNSGMFLPLHSIKRTRNIYRSVTQCYNLGCQFFKF